MVPQVQISSKISFLTNEKKNDDTLYFSFAGGVGEFGANLSAFCFRQTFFWIDAGAGFPTYENPGAERLLPSREVLCRFNPQYIILTHAHEDHIGAIPYFYDYLPQGVTFFLSPFTKAALFSKFAENEQDETKFKFVEIARNQKIETDNITFSFFFFPHSIPQSFGVGVELNNSQKTKLFFSGDFKLNQEEKKFSALDIKNFSHVDYLFCDSTGSLSEGRSGSEQEVTSNIENLIQNWEGRIFITTFSSNILRLKEIFRIAQNNSRPVGSIGYSIRNHLKIAFSTDDFDFPTLREISPQNPRAIWLVAGCQADEGSSLYRLVREEIPRFKLSHKDLIIYSASKIPGNEKKIYQILNLAIEQGARIEGLRQGQPPLHVSGHAKADELKELIEMLRPHNLIPVHGDALHFQAFDDLAKELPQKILPQIKKTRAGVIYSLDKSGMHEFSKIGQTFFWVEEGEIHNQPSLFSRRRELSEQGVCTLIVRQENFELLHLSYVGVMSEKKLKSLQHVLDEEVKSILDGVHILATEKKEKRIREKLYRLNLSLLQKSPFIHLVFV